MPSLSKPKFMDSPASGQVKSPDVGKEFLRGVKVKSLPDKSRRPSARESRGFKGF